MNDASEHDKSRWSGLKTRIIYGAAFALIALFLTIYSPLSFYGLVLIGALIMHTEWLEITKERGRLFRGLGGLLYVGLPVWSLIALRDEALVYVLWLFSVVWATDIGAYFGGKTYGKHKLAPSISPGKTIEGLGAGMLAATLVGMCGVFYTNMPYMSLLIISPTLALVSQMGDLFESSLKRQAGVKDSGTIIPGHGGLLDRVDGLIFAAPVYAAFVMI